LWDGINWFFDHQYQYTYDGMNNITVELYQIHNGIDWQNISQSLFTYDGNHNQTLWTYQDWNTSSWVNNFRYINTFDSVNNRTSYVYQSWTAGNWLNSDSTFFYYHDHILTGLAANTTIKNQISIFPNPSSSELKITFVGSNINEISIHNRLGQEIFRENCRNSSELIVNVSSWPAGIYFVRIENIDQSDFKSVKVEIVH
jgi:hypothetical protein